MKRLDGSRGALTEASPPRKVLDLFCGAGGVSMGLRRAWPDAEICGIDIQPKIRYPFRFYQADVMEIIWNNSVYNQFRLRNFDFIWASPPCQAYSLASSMSRKNGKEYPDLVAPVRAALKASGVPWCMENVPQAPLLNPVTLCGTMFDLRVFRHRCFESSFPFAAPSKCSHVGKRIGEGYYSVAGGAGRWRTWNGTQRDVSKGTVGEWRTAMGIDWMVREELTQAIPPAYSEYIAKQFSAAQPARRAEQSPSKIVLGEG